MDARPCRIIEFFDGTKQMMVPLFQRPYEWGLDQWETLWSDILERYMRAGEDPPDASHFTGAIVTAPARSVPVGVNKFLVIDGQQRLTTVAILLCAIRQRLDPTSKRYRQVTRLLMNEDYEGNDIFKLLPTQPDRPAWQALLENPDSASDSRFHRAYQFFVTQLQGTDDDGAPIDAARLYETVQQRLNVVFIHLGENDDPYLIFESLNAKGAPLTQADLVRNYLLLRMHAQTQEQVYQQQWLPMQQRLGDSLPEYVRQYLMQRGEDVSKGEVYIVLKRRTQQVSDTEMPREIAELATSSVHYQRIIDPSQEPHEGIRRGLQRLKRWEMATSHPLLLRIYGGYARGHVTADEFVECLSMIESFGVRRYICSVPTNQLKRIFLSLVSTVQPGVTATNIRAKLVEGAHGKRWPKDEECKEQWIRFRMYSKPVDRCRFILEALEEAHGHREGVDPSAATIEHVLPQTLSDEWRTTLGADADSLHDRWVHTIGNLTLSAYNGELSNSPFSEKKKLLKDSHFELNKNIAQCANWTPEEIQARASAMWALASKIWPRST